MSDFGTFEVLASAPDMEREAQREVSDKLAAAVYDVREQFGGFLFQAKDIHEFRNRAALIKDDAMRVVNAHLMPVTSVMRHIGLTARNGILEKEFRQRLAAEYKTHSPTNVQVNAQDPDGRNWEGYFGTPERAEEWGKSRDVGDPYNAIPQHGHAARQAATEQQEPLPDMPVPPAEKNYPSGVPGPEHLNDPEWQEFFQDNPHWKSWVGRQKRGRRRHADATGPDMNIQDTYQEHQGDELAPEGNFHGYLDSVDQGAPSKVDGDFDGSRNGVEEHTGDPASTNFVEGSRVVRQYAAFCRRNRIPLTLGALERHGKQLNPGEYLTIAAALQRRSSEEDPIPSDALPRLKGRPIPNSPDIPGETVDEPPYGWPKDNGDMEEYPPGSGQKWPKHGRRRQAAPDYLQKADEALTNLLTQKAEEFQTSIQSLQQALQVVQQAEVAQQAANPMGVQPPAGTVNVLPQQAADPAAQGLAGAGGPPPGADPSLAPGGDPTGGGDQMAPPPAAGDPSQQLAAGRKRAYGPSDYAGNDDRRVPYVPESERCPDCGGVDGRHDDGPHRTDRDSPSRRAKRGGRGKAQGAARSHTGAGGVLDLWNKWSQDPNNTTRGDETDIDSFATAHGVGERGKSQLRNHLWGAPAPLATGMRKGAPFADYSDFAECEDANDDKRDPDAYCGEVKHRTEDKQGRRCRAEYSGSGDVQDESGPFAGPDDSFPVGTEKDKNDAKSVCNMPSVKNKHPGTCEKVEKMSVRKVGWTGWGPAQENRGHTRKAGWDWDNHLLAYTSSTPRQFECGCGEQLEVPGYHNCRCGKIWNGYVIGTGGDNHEASAEKFLVREVPVRPDVIVANRREAFGEIPHDPHGGQPPVNLTWHPTQTLIKEHLTGDHPWHGDIGRELGYRANRDDGDAMRYLQHAAARLGYADPFGDLKPLGRDRIHQMHSDRESWHADDDIPFPSDHHPKIPKTPATPDDWHSRVPNGQWSSNPAPRRKTKRKTVTV